MLENIILNRNTITYYINAIDKLIKQFLEREKGYNCGGPLKDRSKPITKGWNILGYSFTKGCCF